MERLQKVIAQSGFCSRRKAEELIQAGRVKVDGKVCDVLGTKVDKGAKIMIDDKPLERETFVYFLFHKPKNCLSTVSDDRKRPTIMNYFKKVPERIFPIGRLDFDTTGALIMTNDGELANKLMHPRYGITKVYQVQCLGRLDDSDLDKLRKGLILSDGLAKVTKASLLSYNEELNLSKLELEVVEGRKHLIKRLIEALGSEVVSLYRRSFAGLEVSTLRLGAYRELTSKEVDILKNLNKQKVSKK
ncbi:MAG: pseudouridine synthase [Bacilli bacterium]|jgi:23S rRNA pseudouridine2605 synthase